VEVFLRPVGHCLPLPRPKVPDVPYCLHRDSVFLSEHPRRGVASFAARLCQEDFNGLTCVDDAVFKFAAWDDAGLGLLLNERYPVMLVWDVLK